MSRKLMTVLGLGLFACSCSSPDGADPAAKADFSTSEVPRETAPQSIAAPSPEVLALGLRAWDQGKCSKCHGANGKGGPRAPDLTDDQWIQCDGSIEGIQTVLNSGVPKERLHDPSRPFQMNPATNLIKDEQSIAALAAYVWSLSH
jgi:mono/diheme cytochrome c family protein